MYSKHEQGLPTKKLIDLPVGTAFRFWMKSHSIWDPYRSIVLDRCPNKGLVQHGKFVHNSTSWTEDVEQEVQLAYGDRLDDWVRAEYPKEIDNA